MKTQIDLTHILQEAGVQVSRESGDEVWGLCPMHRQRTGRDDSHPSWSVNTRSYVHNCFSCGYRGSLTQLLIDLTGEAPADLEQTLKEQGFLGKMAEAKRSGEILEEVEPLLTDWEIRNVLVDVSDKLLATRRLKRPAVDHYEVRWDSEKKSWVLPLRDRFGKIIGAQYRSSASRPMTNPEGLKKSELLFGYRQVRSYNHVVLVESPLDAIRLYGLGIPGVASLGAWVSAYQCRQLARTFSRVYLALDNDDAGWAGAEKAANMIQNFGATPVLWDYMDCEREGRR